MQTLTRAVMNGAIAGGIATTLMTAFMKAYQATDLYRGKLPPTRVTEKSLDATGVDYDEGGTTEVVTIAAGHWGYGMAGGAFFAALRRLLGISIPAVLHGTLFGLLVWGVSYMGWVPAAGIMPPPWRQRSEQALMPLLAHVVYGSVLGVAFDRLERR